MSPMRLVAGVEGGEDDHGEGAEGGYRFQPAARRAVDVVGCRQDVGEEDRIELRRFRLLGAIDVISGITERKG